jgi:hypothetical protein
LLPSANPLSPSALLCSTLRKLCRTSMQHLCTRYLQHLCANRLHQWLQRCTNGRSSSSNCRSNASHERSCSSSRSSKASSVITGSVAKSFVIQRVRADFSASPFFILIDDVWYSAWNRIHLLSCH